MTEIKLPITHRPPEETFRIMVLDTPDHIEALTLACELDGHQVVPVTSIASGMRFLDTKDRIDIVISTIHLEEESVFDFFRVLRSKPEHKDVKFMMICSSSTDFSLAVNDAIETAAQVMGVDKYLMMKNYDVTRLVKELEAMLPNRLPKRERMGEQPT